tara:strand:+ start:699 stop:1844 length:1146 start_codon:yes stop_codon:yes gene_type:complete
MLEDLQPAPKLNSPKDFRPGVQFDGTLGTATTEGLPDQPNFDDFLFERGYSPDEYEVLGNTVRTSQWQRYDGEWLTSYRFTFRKRLASVDMPALLAEAKKSKPIITKKTNSNTALIICPADLQVGKTGSRGGTPALITRVMESYSKLEKIAKQGKYERIWILDMGDIIESVSNKASMNQLEGNDLSVPQQTDLAAALMFDLIKRMVKIAPVTYGSVASNHCQNRVNGQQVGKPGLDDWGIVILQQLRRLTTELEWDVDYLIPQPYDEGFAFQYGINTIGVVHGHQVSRPDGIPKWWQSQTFDDTSWAAPCNTLISAHFHHLKVTELVQHAQGGSKYWVQCPTSDSGSDWYRNAGGGGDSSTGILCLELEKDSLFNGSVKKL